MRIVVVLPAPLGPMNPNRSPRFRFKLIDLIANNSPYFFVKSRVSIIEKLSKVTVGNSAEYCIKSLPTFAPLHRQHKPIYYRGLLLIVAERRPRCIINQLGDRPRRIGDEDRSAQFQRAAQ